MARKDFTQNYTTTGQKTLVNIDPFSKVTFFVKVVGVVDYDVNVRLSEGSALREIPEGLGNLTGDVKPKTLSGPISGIGLNINSLDVGASITLEIMSI